MTFTGLRHFFQRPTPSKRDFWQLKIEPKSVSEIPTSRDLAKTKRYNPHTLDLLPRLKLLSPRVLLVIGLLAVAPASYMLRQPFASGLSVLSFIGLFLLLLAWIVGKITRIDGWLALLIAWLCLAFLLDGAYVIRARDNYPMAALSAAFLALDGSAAYLLSIKDRKGVLVAKSLFAARLVVVVLYIVTDAAVVQRSLEAVVTVAWLLYLLRSKHVREMYFPASTDKSFANS